MPWPKDAAIMAFEKATTFGQNANICFNVGLLVPLKFVYLALGCGAAAFLQVACWMITGERQAVRIRTLYLKTILQQDIAFFDKEIHTGTMEIRITSHHQGMKCFLKHANEMRNAHTSLLMILKLL